MGQTSFRERYPPSVMSKACEQKEWLRDGAGEGGERARPAEGGRPMTSRRWRSRKRSWGWVCEVPSDASADLARQPVGNLDPLCFGYVQRRREIHPRRDFR